MAEYGREVEADLLEVYGVDLSDLYTGGLTPRRCWLLIEQLPPGSRVARAMGGDGAWDTHTHAIVGMLSAIRSDLAGKKLPAPEPPAPGWREKQREREAAKRRRARRYYQ